MGGKFGRSWRAAGDEGEECGTAAGRKRTGEREHVSLEERFTFWIGFVTKQIGGAVI
jgi:hypothetical protein